MGKKALAETFERERERERERETSQWMLIGADR
jgi:hypothetical protein